jgi:hypothetical protein
MPPEFVELLKNPWFYLTSLIIGFLSYKILPAPQRFQWVDP